MIYTSMVSTHTRRILKRGTFSRAHATHPTLHLSLKCLGICGSYAHLFLHRLQPESPWSSQNRRSRFCQGQKRQSGLRIRQYTDQQPTTVRANLRHRLAISTTIKWDDEPLERTESQLILGGLWFESFCRQIDRKTDRQLTDNHYLDANQCSLQQVE